MVVRRVSNSSAMHTAAPSGEGIPRQQRGLLIPASGARGAPLGPLVRYGANDLRALEGEWGGSTSERIGRGNRRQRRLEEILEQVTQSYPVGHPNLTVVRDQLDLDRLHDEVAQLSPRGRECDTHPLVAAVMAVPHALHGQFDGSPRAKEFGAINCPRKALEEHANYVRVLLHHNVKVFLLLQEGHTLYSNALTEGVFTQDPVIPLGKAFCIANMGHRDRRLETKAFRGGFQVRNFCEPGGSVEGGDVIPLHGNALRPDEPIQVVFQGLNGLRSSPASIRGMHRLLDTLHLLHAIDAPQLVPVELAGKHVLHLDYALSIMGIGDQRTMVVCPNALKDGPPTRNKIAAIAGTENIIEVSMAGMEAGLANFGIIDETTVVMVEPTSTHFRDAWSEFERMLYRLTDLRFTVIPLRYEQPTQKDGGFRCTRWGVTAPSFGNGAVAA
jgi:N-dimethylarginine dimethylaminohydrolase